MLTELAVKQRSIFYKPNWPQFAETKVLCLGEKFTFYRCYQPFHGRVHHFSLRRLYCLDQQ